MSGPVVLLGPQRPAPSLRDALDALDARPTADPRRRGGPIVCITAGWRLDEGDDAQLRREIHPDATSLPLYAAFERVGRAAPELAQAYKARQARVRRIKQLYRVRLHPGMSAARRLIGRMSGDPELVEPFLEASVRALMEMDEHFLAQVDQVHGGFDVAEDPLKHPEVDAFRAEAQALLARARAVVVTGGHVGVLRNRLAFFGMDALLRAANTDGLAIAAWSAGAMALTERVVLFHDDPPHGVGDPELLDRGLGIVPDLVLFPGARQRLRLDDGPRVGVLARRFGPARCITLESGARLCAEGGVWRNLGPAESASELLATGELRPLPGRGGDHAQAR